MGIAEILIVKLGTATTRALLQSWLKDSPRATLTGDTVEIIASNLSNIVQARRVERELTRVAESVAEKLSPYLDAEFGYVPENEKMAALAAVADTVSSTVLTTKELATLDFDPRRLEKHLRTRRKAVASRAGLSEAAIVLYGFVLQEVCNYLVDLHAGLPPFKTAAAQELLQREGAISAQLQIVLDNLPAAIVPEQWGSGGEDTRFENEYLRRLSHSLDYLELFGLDVDPAYKRYQLSVAYISLSATQQEVDDSTSARGGRDDIEENIAGSDSGTDTVTVESALSSSNRLLIRGWAGSGKTTLLQWVAVAAAKRSFDGDLASWNGKVPFFLQLRRWVHKDPPPPEEFLRYTTPQIIGAMPQGYVHRVLAAGRGLVLIDGVDEVPENDREQIRSWLDSLVETFPDCIYLVTSRPPALENTWMRLESFLLWDLQPMDLGDIRSFISHWHAAAAITILDSALQASLADLRDRLQSLIRDNRALRSLATSPLLCAMLCALNRDRGSRLPRSRMELYRIAIETLLVRRDPERRVPDETSNQLLQREQEVLLQDFALWLIENNQSDAETEFVVRGIERRLRYMPNVRMDASQVFKHLLVRSGMLRQPVEGRIDFLHRTFQEYFAARELIDNEAIGELIANAHLDQWREVVILACGHASKLERTRLLQGLIHRGDEEREYRHRLHLLAVACLETATQIEPDLQRSLAKRLNSLMPPRNMTEAGAVASAGELAVPPLAIKKRSATTQAACVRALALIGTPEALETLRGYARDNRVTVIRELVRAWSYFDPEAYASQVLSLSPLEYGHLGTKDPSILEYLHLLPNLRSVYCDMSGRLNNLEPLRAVPNLVGLVADRCYQVESLDPLREQAHLRTFSITGNARVSSLEPLRGQPLRHLDLTGCRGIEDISPLEECETLLRAYLDRTSIRSLDALSPSAGVLEVLWFDGTSVTSIAGLARTVNLRYLTMTGSRVQSLEPLSDSARLGRLFAQNIAPGALASLPVLHSLTELKLGGVHESELDALKLQPNLWSLSISGCADAQGLEFLRGCRALRHLTIEDFSGLQSVAAISTLEKLDYLVIRRSAKISDLELLAGAPNLSNVSLFGVDGSRLASLGFQRRGQFSYRRDLAK